MSSGPCGRRARGQEGPDPASRFLPGGEEPGPSHSTELRASLLVQGLLSAPALPCGRRCCATCVCSWELLPRTRLTADMADCTQGSLLRWPSPQQRGAGREGPCAARTSRSCPDVLDPDFLTTPVPAAAAHGDFTVTCRAPCREENRFCAFPLPFRSSCNIFFRSLKKHRSVQGLTESLRKSFPCHPGSVSHRANT